MFEKIQLDLLANVHVRFIDGQIVWNIYSSRTICEHFLEEQT